MSDLTLGGGLTQVLSRGVVSVDFGFSVRLGSFEFFDFFDLFPKKFFVKSMAKLREKLKLGNRY